MSNDPNDRFMISDLSSKLSAYINGENSDQASPTRDPAEIEDVFASEIRPANPVRKTPGDDLFSDLDQALDAQPDVREEQLRKQRIAEERIKRAEEDRRQQLINEQRRKQQLKEEQQRRREEQLRQQRLKEEQLRLREEQLRQQKLRREKALARALAESLYIFDLDQTFTSVRSGHSVRYSKLSPAVRSMPSEAALKNALAKIAQADRVRQTEASHEAPASPTSYEAPKAAASYEAPKAPSSYEAPTNTYYETPREEISPASPVAETAFEIPPTETAYDSSTSNEESVQLSQPAGESRYAKSPDPLYKGYQEENRGGGHIAVIIALLVALLAVAAVFIIIRRYSSNLTNLLTGTPAAGTTETASVTESLAESEKEEAATEEESEYTDSRSVEESQAAVSMAINEEGEIYHSDSLPTETEDSGELVPEDPTDISYLASVNKKAAEDAIAELSETAPKLYLSSYGIKIKAGDSFNALSYVERIEDDADERDRLYRDISVDGLGDFDSKVPGTYELTYFCYDSAGNRSNRARLTVIVE